MRLYHGTSSTRLPSILKRGIRPRGDRRGNPVTDLGESNPDAVYLTTIFPLFYATRAARADKHAGSRAAVIEIDSEQLHTPSLVPDEDALASLVAIGLVAHVVEKVDLPQDVVLCLEEYINSPADLMATARRLMPTLGGALDMSLTMLGTCAYIGTVPPSAISRGVVFDPGRTNALFQQACEAQPSVAAHASKSQMLRGALEWLFGDDPSEGFQFGVREGITVTEPGRALSAA